MRADATMLSSGSMQYGRPNTKSWTRARRASRGGGEGLILVRVCGDAIQHGADLKHESVAEALLVLCVVLRALEIRFCERRDAKGRLKEG
jgi:hypothetical protein